MKSYLFKVSLSLLLISVASFCFGQTDNDIKFEKKTQKFKKVDEGKLVTLSYSFFYQGDLPLSIVPPQVDCSCTEVILPNHKIKPNTLDTITVKFNTTDKIGYQDRDITIHFTSDAMDSRSIKKTITFKGVIKATAATKEAYKNHKKD